MTINDTIKAAAATAIVTFVTTFLVTVQNWVGQGTLPDWSAIKAAAMSAALAALTGLANFAARWVQSRLAIGELPTYVRITKLR